LLDGGFIPPNVVGGLIILKPPVEGNRFWPPESEFNGFGNPDVLPVGDAGEPGICIPNAGEGGTGALSR